MSKAKKKFQLKWIFELLEEIEDLHLKPMFGALAAYGNGKMLLLISESKSDRSWKGQSYDFDIWNGLLLPTEHEFQKSLKEDYPELVRHPVLPKWLYLPITVSRFETLAEEFCEKILEQDPRFGVVPKIKKKKSKKKTQRKK